MFSSQSFVALLTLALTVAATPVVVRDTPVTLPFAKHINATGVANILQRDQARAKFLKARGHASPFNEDASSFPVTNTAVSYVASVSTQRPVCNCAYDADAESNRSESVAPLLLVSGIWFRHHSVEF